VLERLLLKSPILVMDMNSEYSVMKVLSSLFKHYPFVIYNNRKGVSGVPNISFSPTVRQEMSNHFHQRCGTKRHRRSSPQTSQVSLVYNLFYS
jgi:hypothetical protein